MGAHVNRAPHGNKTTVSTADGTLSGAEESVLRLERSLAAVVERVAASLGCAKGAVPEARVVEHRCERSRIESVETFHGRRPPA